MGVFTAATMKVYRGDKAWAEKERVERIAKIHRISGYIMLLLGNVAIATGLTNYYKHKLNDDDRWIQGPISVWTFILIVIVFETTYRCRNKFSLGHIKTPAEGVKESYTPQRVDEEVAKGRPLVIFDNLVLDVGDYPAHHPGGKFNFTHNYGRDVSKFFFGGYNLVNVPGKIRRPHHHS